MSGLAVTAPLWGLVVCTAALIWALLREGQR